MTKPLLAAAALSVLALAGGGRAADDPPKPAAAATSPAGARATAEAAPKPVDAREPQKPPPAWQPTRTSASQDGDMPPACGGMTSMRGQH